MVLRAAVAWLAMVVLAILNGGFREAFLVSRLGNQAAHVASTLSLCALILLAAWVLLRWIRPRTAADTWRVGVLWLLLTEAFEFVAGHYLFGTSWEELFGAYNVARGQVWLLVPVTTLLAPVLLHPTQGRPT